MYGMIGVTITGTDISGVSCTGKIVDKVLCLQSIEVKQPGTVGRGQQVPIPLDAYLVLGATLSLHLVNPMHIKEVVQPQYEEMMTDIIKSCIEVEPAKPE